MKSTRLFVILFLLISIFVFGFSCKDETSPVLITNDVTEITESTAMLNAEINSEDLEVLVRGFVWDTISNPDLDKNIDKSENGAGVGKYSHQLTDLLDGEMYYFRAYAQTEQGITYGGETSFTTDEILWNGTPCPDCATITDIDGNVYRTVLIGNQCWLVENLRTTKYKDGEQIPITTDNIEWKNATSAAMCYYNNDSENSVNYGILYNFYAVETGKLCPEGWHVATDNEWKELEGFVDTEYGIGNNIWDTEGWRGSDVGVKLKSANGWLGGSEQNGTDDYGFLGLPAGLREGNNGEFQRVEEWGLWWSAKNTDETNVYRRYLGNHENNIARFPSNMANGHSVRCIKD